MRYNSSRRGRKVIRRGRKGLAYVTLLCALCEKYIGSRRGRKVIRRGRKGLEYVGATLRYLRERNRFTRRTQS